jgi:hypothetical protein
MRHSRRTDVKQVPLENSTLSLEEPYVQIWCNPRTEGTG